MKTSLLILITSLLLAINCEAQNSVGIGTTTPNANAALDISSTTKALLPPRMSYSQILAIPNPTAGMIVYDTDARAFRYYNGSAWVILGARESHLSDAPGNFTSTPLAGTSSLYWYYTPSGFTRIAADKSLYFIAATSGGTANIGNIALNNTSNNNGVIFAKMDSLGNPLWAKQLTSPASSYISCWGLDVDAAGNLYIGGSFSGTVDFDPGAAVHSLTATGSSYDAYYAKYDASGNYLWVQKLGGSTGSDAVKGLCTDGTSLYLCGDYSSTITFGSGSALQTGTGQNIFLARVQASDGLPGATGWIKTAYCTGNSAATSIKVKLYSGSLVWCGDYSSTINFTGGIAKTSAGAQDCFFGVYNSFGGTSASNIVSYGGPNPDFVYDLATSSTGNILLCGYFGNSITFSGITYTAGSATNISGYLVQYNSSLAFNSFYRYGGTTSTDMCYTVGVDNAGYVYLGGSSNSDLNILGRNPAFGTSYGVAFLMKLTSNFNPVWYHLADSYSYYYSDFTNGLDVSGDGKTVFSTVSVGDNTNVIGYDGAKVPSPNYFYLSLYRSSAWRDSEDHLVRPTTAARINKVMPKRCDTR